MKLRMVLNMKNGEIIMREVDVDKLFFRPMEDETKMELTCLIPGAKFIFNKSDVKSVLMEKEATIDLTEIDSNKVYRIYSAVVIK